jgi:hypothetical protein
VSDQIIDDVDVAVFCGPHKSVVQIHIDSQLAGFEHLLHIRQSTMGSVITECLNFVRHLQSASVARSRKR